MNTTPTQSGIHMANGFDPAEGVALDPAAEQLLRRRDRVLGPSYRLFYREPVAVESAKGSGCAAWTVGTTSTPTTTCPRSGTAIPRSPRR
ncbi:hypothetical protein [Leucobacter soli]|uniref:hypothetical protein n=1 Tax=Leucobacter soli TaxID=2812850 RepID=UPI00361DF797